VIAHRLVAGAATVALHLTVIAAVLWSDASVRASAGQDARDVEARATAAPAAASASALGRTARSSSSLPGPTARSAYARETRS
jgi:hypothetical protein